MFCKNCGKELSDEAIMCPNCGTPTVSAAKKKGGVSPKAVQTTGETGAKAGAVIAFTASLIALVCGSFFIAFTKLRWYSYGNSYPLLGVVFGITMGFLTISTALIGLFGGIYAISHTAGVKNKFFSIAATVFSAGILLTFFMMFWLSYLNLY